VYLLTVGLGVHYVLGLGFIQDLFFFGRFGLTSLSKEESILDRVTSITAASRKTDVTWWDAVQVPVTVRYVYNAFTRRLCTKWSMTV